MSKKIRLALVLYCVGFASLLGFGACDSSSDETVSESVDATSAKSIELGPDTGVDIPEGSIAEGDGPITVTVTRLDELPADLPEGQEAAGKSVEFTKDPADVAFVKAVSIRLPYDASVDASELAVYRLDDRDDDTWEAVEGASFANGVATLSVTEFSVYVVARGEQDEQTNDEENLSILLEAEDTVTEGLVPGEDVENIKDGWTITFSKYIVAVGEVDVHLATDEEVEAEAEDLFAVDLTEIPQAGLPLWGLSLQPGDWEFFYRTNGVAHGAQRHETVSEEDFEEMKENDWTYLIEGTMKKDDGVSCPPVTPEGEDVPENEGENNGGDACFAATEISFRFGVKAETSFGPCEVDEMPGFNIPEGGSQTVAITIHGDHMFFNGFPEGDEGGVTRLAQWLADSDLNLDGTVERSELESINSDSLFAVADYDFGGAPFNVTTMWDYVEAQLKTQGHYQGEGECPVDGVAHSHD